jgi:hypothetical protein
MLECKARERSLVVAKQACSLIRSVLTDTVGRIHTGKVSTFSTFEIVTKTSWNDIVILESVHFIHSLMSDFIT